MCSGRGMGYKSFDVQYCMGVGEYGGDEVWAVWVRVLAFTRTP
jgi:hypothetical protein